MYYVNSSSVSVIQYPRPYIGVWQTKVLGGS